MVVGNVTLSVGRFHVKLDRHANRDISRGGTIQSEYGRYSRVVDYPTDRENEANFDFDLEGRVKRISGYGLFGTVWDWLQRSLSNEWLYYTNEKMFDMTTTQETTGSYYKPINGRTDLPTISNPDVLQRNKQKGLSEFRILLPRLRELLEERTREIFRVSEERSGRATDEEIEELWRFISTVVDKDQTYLARNAQRLYDVFGFTLGQDELVPVFSPDSIVADYQVFPVLDMVGCPENCGFCTVSGKRPFRNYSREEIDGQFSGLREVYGRDIANFNSVVVGQNDPFTNPEMVLYAAKRAYGELDIANSYPQGSNLFLFIRNRSLLDTPDDVFDRLEELPYENIYLNVGWEAVTNENLGKLGKKQTREEVLAGMKKAAEIMKKGRLIVSGNFISSNVFNRGYTHDIGQALWDTGFRGTAYLSPHLGQCDRETLEGDYSSLVSYEHNNVLLYIMQRL
jgi:hypothetical protein